MNRPWQRQRQPDDVPTPVAVAVSDYCRRAHSPATPTEVREALALLADADDFRVRSLTDAEPGATPLGPFAVVDVLHGTAPSLAATRQGCGYYEVVRELARVHEEKRPPAPPAPDVPTFAIPPPRAASPDVPARRESLPANETVQSRIAPRKRAAAEPPAVEADEQEGPSFLKRDLPKPRGRFTRLDAPKSSFQELTRSSGKDILEGLMESNENRFALHKALSQQYNGARGELTLGEMETVLKEQGVMDALEEREHAAILAAFTEHRGASGRVGWALGLSPSELKQLEAKLGISEQVEAVRERFRREALTGRHLTQKLDLLGREKYLVDLGIKKRFSDMLRRELEVLVREEGPEVTSLSALSEAIGRKHGAPSELVLRALERLGVVEGHLKRTPSSPHSTS
ncbi:hypothetical protein [Melittangium boletus]|uniref:Uncharacterized protein n=1 Tax=Melittangium boletus DSM 14713 TaxID=1294270 RepID=A0A250IQU1_9BACT|nr:hypothetical protein [Melittangium boletus]ATB33531.1 hypothetical protein MEBOL_007029 [Melittangium boletus DSM 14713]